MKHLITKLPNGLTVLEVPSSDAESVLVDFFVKTGSRSETLKENGISHFLEHFLFKGTKRYPSALAISSLVDSIGGEMNANTGKEHTQYFIKSAHRHLPVIFGVLTDMLQRPLLDTAELEREKGVIVEEINMYKDTPTIEIENVLEAMMWPDQPLGRDIAGTPAAVTAFTRDMFKDYINRYYQTRNMILGVSGKYDRQSLWRLIRTHWEQIPARPHEGWEKAIDLQKEARVKIAHKATEQAHLSLGFKGLRYDDLRNPAASLLAAILGGGMSSRLFIEVRERRGLAYYVRAHSGNYQDTGAFTLGAGVQVKKIEEAVKVIIGELNKITDKNILAKELKKSKEYLKGRITLALEDNHARLDWYLEQLAFHPRIETPQQIFSRLDRVSAADVKKLAREIFQKRNLTLAVIGPYRGQEQKFRRLLRMR